MLYPYILDAGHWVQLVTKPTVSLMSQVVTAAIAVLVVVVVVVVVVAVIVLILI